MRTICCKWSAIWKKKKNEMTFNVLFLQSNYIAMIDVEDIDNAILYLLLSNDQIRDWTSQRGRDAVESREFFLCPYQ